ncbi:MAG: response regulator transcription factor, partial [Roseiflexaceae bacterium]
DDYITKPFSPREVVARVRVVLRRSGAEREQEPATVHFRQLTVDFVGHAARLRGDLLRLTPKEFKLLETLIKQPGRAWSRLDLLEQVFGFDYEGLERTVDVHVMNLRRKIEHDPAQPEYIQTVYGIGYKFAEDDDVV